ncbi:MAG: S9 family peptidase [Ilumatobacteraceae bacterium]
MPSPVPIDACIGAREITEPRLTPDGESVVYAVSHAGETALVIQDLGSDGGVIGHPRVLPTVPAPRPGRGLGGGCWTFTPDADAVVYAAVDGNLWLQPLDGTLGRPITHQGPERVAQAPATTPLSSLVVYIVDQAEVWAVSLDDGRARRLDDGSGEFVFDPQLTPDGREVAWVAWDVPSMPWDASRIERRGIDDDRQSVLRPSSSVQQPRFLPDGTLVSVRDDTGYLVVWVGDRPLVDEPFEHAGPTWGPGQRSFAVSGDGSAIAFTRNEDGFGRLCVALVATGEVRELGRGVHGQLSWVGDRIVALRSGARTPTEVVLYDARSGARSVVATAPIATWDRASLVEPVLIEVTAVDGGVVPARLYEAERVAGEPRRLIAWVHGGPTDQWQVAFMPRIEFWRSRGWDVVIPDHRGSTGHGRAHQQSMNGRWGELDVDDTAAVVRSLHARSIGAPERTVMMGGSAGGFTVLGILGRHPDLACAAVVSYPVTDLLDLAERSHRFERHSVRSLVGEPGTPAVDARYLDRSPVTFAHRIATPLLVFHGEDDPVVPVAQSRELADRIASAGGDVELIVYPGEGHGFRNPEHQRDEYERTERFLELHVR